MTRTPIDFDALAGLKPAPRPCDEPGCQAAGEFRAPRSRDDLNNFYWFCIDHVRRYNAAWNYCAGMNEEAIEDEIRRDTVWHRPSWPLGWRTAWQRFSDPLGVFKPSSGTDRRSREERRRDTAEEKAAALFDLVPPFTLAELKRRYKLLVKRHHPDANGGDKAAEERLKLINQAYSLLKARFAAR